MKPVHSYRSIPFVAPFAVFLTFIALRNELPFGPEWEYPLRVVVVSAVVLLASRGVIFGRPAHAVSSIVIGVLVFAIWVAPDVLWPTYRNHWLFQNFLTGSQAGALPPNLRTDFVFLTFRILGTIAVVPIIEELFWRGWLMRYLIAPDFEKVPLGAYSASAMWLTAVLFAAEHGPFWDVGLATGLIYNWWMLRTRNLADCMIAHAVTNGCLAVYVVQFGQWQYWL